MAVDRAPVALTRASADNAALAARLRADGFDVLEWPTTAPQPRALATPGGAQDVQAAIRRAQWVVFTSRRAVAALLDLGVAEEVGACAVAAVGEATAEELRRNDIHVEVTGDGRGAATFAPLLARRLAPGTRVLLLRSSLADDVLPEALTHAGLVVEALSLYEAVEAPRPEGVEQRPLAAIVAASPSAARRVLAWFPWTRTAPWVAIGPTTERALRAELGVADVTVAASPTDEAVLRAVVARTSTGPSQDGGPAPAARPRSAALFARACEVTPGGVHSPVRAFRAVGGAPIFIERAEGAWLFDVDGRRYLDACMSWGPLVLGHAHAAVVDAVREAAGRGLSYGACHPGEPALAEAILEGFPADRDRRVRFTSSGTEAVMTAVRLARAHSGRSLVLKFEGGYHGHSDGLLVAGGSGLATFGVAASEGVPPEIARLTIVAPLADVAALEQAFEEHGHELACVLLEPVPANDGLLVQEESWLRRVDELCERHGVVLVSDEVITGWRLRYGPHRPSSLTTLGKIVGGGMPLAAVVGDAAVMDRLAPIGRVYQAGTLSGNPVSVAAGLATLGLLRSGEAHARLEALGSRFERRLMAQAERGALQLQRVGSMLWPLLSAEPLPRRSSEIPRGAVDRYARVHGRMLERGFYLPPSARETWFLSTAHSEADVDALADALAQEAGRVAGDSARS